MQPKTITLFVLIFSAEEGMRKHSKLSSGLAVILDKKLYGRSFFTTSSPYLIGGIIIQIVLFFLTLPYHLIIFLPLHIGLIIVTGFAAKNSKKEFHPMGWWLALLLLFSSIFSKGFALTAPFMLAPPGNIFIAFLEFFVVLIVSEFAFVIALISITVFGQRSSLRHNAELDEDFFEKEKDRWRNEVEAFPNFDNVLEGLDEGRFVADLFDKGFFNLTVLWSCNVMEQVIDAMIDGIISRTPENEIFQLFRIEEGRRRRYPVQLENLGYKFVIKHQKRKEFNIDILWHKIRNDIAHRNYRPTFEETIETLKILTSFVKETPLILRRWSSETSKEEIEESPS